MFIEILKYGFLIIFLATALIGILSLPGWLKIDEWYRKKIFIALILEVVGAIIILFNQEFITTRSKEIPEITISENEWIALNNSGLIVKPEINIKNQDTTIIKYFGKQSYIEFKNLTSKVVDDGLSIRNSDGITLAIIKAKDLKTNGLFNSFETAENEITSSKNYAYIKWNKRPNSQWKKNGSFIGPFELEVADYTEGTYYLIKNSTNNTTVFDSRDNSKNLISVDNRIIHFYEYDNKYYLLRIAWADLENNEKYIHVINTRMQPTIKTRANN
jgi:hypothetical protein